MRLGCFGHIKDLDLIVVGFDCAELQVKEIMAMSEEEFKSQENAENCGITAEVFDNLFL